MRLCLKVGRTFDFTITFHLFQLFTLPCLVSLFSAQPQICDCTVMFFISTYCINTMDLKSQKP